MGKQLPIVSISGAPEQNQAALEELAPHYDEGDGIPSTPTPSA